MSVGAASKLDTEKFRKVHGLMTAGATEGERSAARARAEAMAARAGMSLKEAMSKLDSRPASPKPKSIFEEMMDSDPEWRASHEAFTSKRDAERASLRDEALAEYGSEDAVFEETEKERLLREVLEPLADWAAFANSGQRYIAGYAGWRAGPMPWVLTQAIMKAYPAAYDIPGLWDEYQEWERLYELRHAFELHYDFPMHVQARRQFLIFNLDTLPDATFEGFAARFEWLKLRTEQDISYDVHQDLSMIATMRVDLAMLRAVHGSKGGGDPSPPSAPARTNAEKRAAVLSILDTSPELSDREIARRVGVSPQTVNTWRKKRAGRADYAGVGAP